MSWIRIINALPHPRAALGMLLALMAMVGAANGEEAKTPGTDLYGDPLPPGAVARLGTIRLRHAWANMIFSKDGKHLISCDLDGQLRIWDVATGKLVRQRTLRSKAAGIENFMVPMRAADGILAAAWDREDREVQLYDADTGQKRGRIAVPRLGSSPRSLKAIPDGKFLMLSCEGKDRAYTVRWADAKAVRHRHTLELPPDTALSSTAATSDGKRLAGIAQVREGQGKDGLHKDLFLWDTATGKLLGRKTILGQIDANYLTFSPDGKTLALSGIGEAVVRLLAADSLEEKARLTAPAALSADSISLPVFSPDGRRLAANGGKHLSGAEGSSCQLALGVLIWDLPEPREPRFLPALSESLIIFAPDGKTFACVHDSAARLYDSASDRPLHRRPGHDQTDLALAVSSNGKLLASWDREGVLRVWDVATSKQIRRWQDRKALYHACFFSDDGKRIAAGGLGGPDFTLRVYDVVNGKPLGRIEREEGMDCLHAAVLSADGKHLIGTYSNTDAHQARTVFWDSISGNLLKQRPYQLKIVRDDPDAGGSFLYSEDHAAFAPDGEQMTVWLGDRAAIASVSTGCLLAKLPEGVRRPLDFSPDGRLLAAMVQPSKEDGPDGEGVEVRSLIETASGQEIIRLKLPAPNHIAFTFEGRGLIVSNRKHLLVWDTTTGEKIYQRAWPESIARQQDIWGNPYVPTLAALPGGRVAESMAEGDILIWDVQASRERGRKLRRELGREELETLWSDLAGDAHTAYRAIDKLTAAPVPALEFLQEKLRPAAEDKRITKLLADLDGRSVPAREAALRELTRSYDRAEPVLRQALENNPSLELRRRIEIILAEPKWASPPSLRTLRAIAVLERIGSPEARRILKILSEGTAARETREAKAALRRLERLAR